MKRLLSVFVSVFLCHAAFSQVIITTADMPVSGDTLRYSTASPIGAVISPKDSGISNLWNYPLTFVSQGIDTYKTAFEVNPIYALTIGPTAYGYKVADSLPGPITIHNVFTFFENNSDSFVAQAYGASMFGVPTASNYAPADVWYRFPLTYKSMDSSGFELNISVAGVGGINQKGYRETRVDGWGVLITPFATGVQCIRVRSVKHEMDSVTFGTTGFPPVPRNTVEYKWLASGEHYPLLWVTSALGPTGAETITSIRYRDVYRDTTTVVPIDTNVAVQQLARRKTEVSAYPNPAPDGIITLSLPESWKSFYVELYDMQGREVGTFTNKRELDMRSLPAGNYLARATCGIQIAYIKIVR